ncbi:MAG: chloride channel protein, partial [Pseudoflavonifractor sp.]
MKDRSAKLPARLQAPVAFLKWLLFACIIGVVCGTVGTAFHYAIAIATGMRAEYAWLIFLLPASGALIVLLYRWCGMEQDRGTNFVLVAVRENQPLRLRTAPLVFIATVLTHLFGGSSGREGAALQLGGSISSRIGRRMGLDEHDSRVITMCGMSAAFAALFGTPLTAAIFAMEVVSVGVMYYAALVPCLLSALVGSGIARLCRVCATAYSVSGVPELTVRTVLQVMGMGVLLALLSVLFCRIMHAAPKLYEKFLPRP